jgi:hypothetical protein
MGRGCSTNREEEEEEKKDVCRILVGEPEGRRQLGRLKCRSVDNIKMDLREV